MKDLSRRRFLSAVSAAAVASPVLSARAQGRPTSITVRDPGSTYVEAYRNAFYLPFEQKTGIKVIPAAAAHEPTAQIKAMVEAKSYIWDVALLSRSAEQSLVAGNLLEMLNIQGSAIDDLPAGYRTPYFAGVDIYATVLAYRTDKFKTAPQGWRDLWNTKDFPGRRALRNHPFDTTEIALMADGVPQNAVYPCDFDRAYRSLQKIRPDVNVWWTSGAQSAQLMQSGEVDMAQMWNGTAQRAIDAGAPVAIQWNQNIHDVEGWTILKGTPKVEAAREFVAFTMAPRQQAILAKYMTYGPANPKAFEFIDPKRAAQLSTYPDYRKAGLQIDNTFWATTKDKAIERFGAWMLK
ncbi:ABC transporter substrate-binding protein [Caenimonas sp. SL110]|uniref:ABC transporter substrate-binding protein n=1 Tax=Caenimonas sp. SL110 TaxID=1450524 RepID=UPI00065336AE|nr:ABC transporter substrate-binding protein [Caenimonas sp. SL110]